MVSNITASGTIRMYHLSEVYLGFSVSEYTSPFNCSSGFGLVARLTKMVVKKFTTHETAATINACPIPLFISNSGAIHAPLPSAIVNPCVAAAASVPQTNPQNAPWPVVRFQNIPSKNVANSGPFTNPKTS